MVTLLPHIKFCKRLSKMAPKMQPEILSREILKPSPSSTKNGHPSIHNLSFFDQMAPTVYVPLLFFYSSETGETDHHKTSLLKISLSVALSRYRLLAGRIKDNVTIDCNDDGVLFVEATVKCNLSEVMKHPDDETLKPLFPDSLSYKDSTLIGPVAVQVTYFQCGGISIGLCMCHKVLDMASMSCFVKQWASVATYSEQEISPEFNIGALYPPLDSLMLEHEPIPPDEVKQCPSKRLVFSGKKIAQLKAVVADHVPNPTRVEVVTALLYKSAISATARASSSGSLKPSVLQQAMNLRGRVFPPLLEGLTGNLIGYFSVSTVKDEEVDLVWLVKELRAMKTHFLSLVKTCKAEEMCSLVLENSKALRAYYNGQEGYFCSSWCGFQLYETDFGWGKPFWVTTVCCVLKNVITLMDTRGGDGIEAFVTLEEDAIALFELDEQLLSFSSFTPIVDYYHD